MVFVGQETQFGKICSHPIIFVTTTFHENIICDPQIFHDPPLFERIWQPR